MNMNTINSTHVRWIGPIASYEAEPIDSEPFTHSGGPAPVLGGYMPVQGEAGWTAHTTDTPLHFEGGQWWVGAPIDRSTQRAVVLIREATRRGLELGGDFTPAEIIVAGLKGREQTPRYGYWLAQQIRIVEGALLIGTVRVAALAEGVLSTSKWSDVEIETKNRLEANLVAVVRGMHQHVGCHHVREHIAAALDAVEAAQLAVPAERTPR